MMWLQVCVLSMILCIVHKLIGFPVAMAVASSSRIPAANDHEAARIRRRTAIDNANAALAASFTDPLPTSRATTRRAARPNTSEARILFRLQRGRGITAAEQQGLFEQCGFCEQFFLASLLRRHLIICVARRY